MIVIGPEICKNKGPNWLFHNPLHNFHRFALIAPNLHLKLRINYSFA